MKKSQPQIKAVICPECNSTQTFELPEVGKTIKVICHHCGTLIVTIKRLGEKKLETKPEDIEIISL